MITLTAEDQAALSEQVTTWAVCWHLMDANGNVRRQTSLDRDIAVTRGAVAGIDLDGIYESISALQASVARHTDAASVDNLDIDALLDEFGITVSDIRAGIFDDVRFILFLVNWSAPTNSGIVLKRGVVGNIKTFARDLGKIEARGLTQLLQQQIVQATSLSCRHVLGDSGCSVDLSVYEVAGVVDSVSSNRVFSLILDSGGTQTPGWFNGGILTFTSGANSGYRGEIKLDTAVDESDIGMFEMIESFPEDIAEGDFVVLTPGCDHEHFVPVDPETGRRDEAQAIVGDCFNKFDNVPNYGGEPFMPGNNAIFKADA